jgi:hypothetical protein
MMTGPRRWGWDDEPGCSSLYQAKKVLVSIHESPLPVEGP